MLDKTLGISGATGVSWSWIQRLVDRDPARHLVWGVSWTVWARFVHVLSHPASLVAWAHHWPLSKVLCTPSGLSGLGSGTPWVCLAHVCWFFLGRGAVHFSQVCHSTWHLSLFVLRLVTKNQSAPTHSLFWWVDCFFRSLLWAVETSAGTAGTSAGERWGTHQPAHLQ